MSLLAGVVRLDLGARRAFVLRRRCHHGLTGVALVALAPVLPGRWPGVALVAGAALCWHDRRDAARWLPDLAVGEPVGA